jgi:hypothetical protein
MMAARFMLGLFAALMLLTPLMAKAPTALITVSGGKLNDALEIKDPEALRRFNPWGGGFIDSPPRRTSAITGPVWPANAVTIYLPRQAERWFTVNSRTIIRETGWFQASEEWESQIQTALAAHNSR